VDKRSKGIAMNENQFVYICDPSKNKECEKTSCKYFCKFTTHPEYSIDGKRYKINADTGKLEAVDS
jgi:hypothetical protein